LKFKKMYVHVCTSTIDVLFFRFDGRIGLLMIDNIK
jgi:hypothetical protein